METQISLLGNVNYFPLSQLIWRSWGNVQNINELFIDETVNNKLTTIEIKAADPSIRKSNHSQDNKKTVPWWKNDWNTAIEKIWKSFQSV